MAQLDLVVRQNKARNEAQHYEEDCEFYGMFEAGSFDEEVTCDLYWVGLTRDESGMLQVEAEYRYDVAQLDGVSNTAGKGWWL
jgi:hypothetical protein